MVKFADPERADQHPIPYGLVGEIIKANPLHEKYFKTNRSVKLYGLRFQILCVKCKRSKCKC